jgi:hypothetical protein
MEEESLLVLVHDAHVPTPGDQIPVIKEKLPRLRLVPVVGGVREVEAQPAAKER